MRRVWVLMCLAACATPYQQKGFGSGGYSDRELSPGMYSIDVQANGFTSRGTVLEYLHRRASELCPAGYSIVDEVQDSKIRVVKLFDTVHVVNKPEGGLIVQCHPALEQAAAVAPEAAPRSARIDRSVVEGNNPVACTLSNDDPRNGFCFLDTDQCEQSYARHSEDHQPCTIVPAASCFLATKVLVRRQTLSCSPTISNCEAKRAESISNPDLEDVPASCSIYRTVGGAS